MVGDFFGPIIGHIAHDHATPPGGLDIDVVITHAAADDTSAAIQYSQRAVCNFDSVKNQKRIGTLALPCDLGFIVGRHEPYIGDRVEYGPLDAGFCKMVGDDDEGALAHEALGVKALARTTLVRYGGSAGRASTRRFGLGALFVQIRMDD
jgi:hypothetical protein